MMLYKITYTMHSATNDLCNLRLVQRASEIEKDLQSRTDAISDVNTKGILEGFKPE